MAALIDPRLRCSTALVAVAEASAAADQDRWWHEAGLRTSMGGLEVGGHAATCRSASVAGVFTCWPRLRATRPCLAAVDLATADAKWVTLTTAVAHYEAIRAEHRRIADIYAEYADVIYYTIRGGKRQGKFRPSKLPLLTSLPPIAEVFNPESKIRPPQQRALSMVGHHRRWLQGYAAAAAVDQVSGHKTRNREATRFIAVSQEGAGGWLDLTPDGTYGTKLTSPEFAVMLQRRGGLDISEARAAFDALEARGVSLTP